MKVGDVFGRYTVQKLINESVEGKRTKYLAECVCLCGTVKIVRRDNLKSGLSESCGCLRNDLVRNACIKHGKSSAETINGTYRCWTHMRHNCKPGLRMSEFDDRWDSFSNFLEDMGESNGRRLGRFDPTLPYSKENCLWVDPRDIQLFSRKGIAFVEIGGKRTSLTDACEIYKVSRQVIYERMVRYGVDFYQAVENDKSVLEKSLNEKLKEKQCI